VKVVAEVLDTLVVEVPVVVPTGKLFLAIASGLQGGQGFNNPEDWEWSHAQGAWGRGNPSQPPSVPP